jgi:hypothetical protein
MFESDLEKLIIGSVIVLWFANGWYLNEKLKAVHKKLDRLSENFNGLREYLYEIDPQFNDERESRDRFNEHMADPENKDMFAGMNDMELIREKEKMGKRTLQTPFVEPE